MNIWSWFLHGDSSHPIRHGWGEGRAFETCISDPLHEHCHLSPFQSHNFLRPSGHWLCHFCPPNYCQPLLFLLSYSHFLFRHHDKILLFTHFSNPHTFTCTHSHNYFQTCVISTLLDTSVSLPFPIIPLSVYCNSLEGPMSPLCSQLSFRANLIFSRNSFNAFPQFARLCSNSLSPCFPAGRVLSLEDIWLCLRQFWLQNQGRRPEASIGK